MSARKAASSKATKPEMTGHISREMRDTAKRIPAFKNWVKQVEEPVQWFAKARRTDGATSQPPSPSKDDVTTMSDDTDEDEVIVFKGRGRTKPRLSQSQPYRPPPQRKSVMALQREEDWEELVAVGTKSRTNSSRAQSMSMDATRTQDWRIVPGRAEEASIPAAMLFTPGEDESSKFRRWLVHSIATYYGLDSTSVDDSETRRRYVFVSERAGHTKGTKKRDCALPAKALWEHL